MKTLAILSAALALAASGVASAQGGPLVPLIEKVALCGVQRPLRLTAVGVPEGPGGQRSARVFAKQFDRGVPEWSGFILVDDRLETSLPAQEAWICRAETGDFQPGEIVLLLASAEEDAEQTTLVRLSLEGAFRQAVIVQGGILGGAEIVVRTLTESEAAPLVAAQLAAWSAYFESTPNPVSD